MRFCPLPLCVAGWFVCVCCWCIFSFNLIQLSQLLIRCKYSAQRMTVRFYMAKRTKEKSFTDALSVRAHMCPFSYSNPLYSTHIHTWISQDYDSVVYSNCKVFCMETPRTIDVSTPSAAIIRESIEYFCSFQR